LLFEQARKHRLDVARIVGLGRAQLSGRDHLRDDAFDGEVGQPKTVVVHPVLSARAHAGLSAGGWRALVLPANDVVRKINSLRIELRCDSCSHCRRRRGSMRVAAMQRRANPVSVNASI
jgi:hypothetical protein